MATPENSKEKSATTKDTPTKSKKTSKLKENIQRFNTLYIINILRMYSSKEHPLSTKEILDKLDETYDPEQLIETSSQSTGRLINRTTIQRQLETFVCCSEFLNDMHCEDFFTADSKEDRLSLNFKIHVMEKLPTESVMYNDITERIKKEYIERLDKKEELEFAKEQTTSTRKKKSKMLYYYYEPSISTDELNDLIRMIETYPNYSAAEVMGRIKKLRSIAPGYFYNQRQGLPIVSDNNRPQNHIVASTQKFKLANNISPKNHLEFNLHMLHTCIHEKRDIKIVYGYYNEKKQLIPRRGYSEGPHRITPYHIVCTNGQYYLVAYNPYRDNGTEKETGIMQYRIDRIIEIHQLDDNDTPGNIGPESKKISFYTALDYTKLHPMMMAGETGRVSFLYRKSSIAVNNLIDYFGYDRFEIYNVDPEVFEQQLGNTKENINDWLQIICRDVAYDSVRMWAKQYCTDCIVYQPTNLKQEIQQELKDAVCNYK